MKVIPFALLLTCLLSSAAAVSAGSLYREYTPTPFYEPDIWQDSNHTVENWGKAGELNESLMGGDEQWRLNWKFMDEPYNDELHGGHVALDRGATLFAELNRTGEFASCLGAEGNDLRGLRAEHYPQFNEAMGKVTGLEAMIEHCAAKQGATLANGSYDNSAVSVFIASQSNGMPYHIDVSQGPLKESYERGMKLFHTRAGWTNFSCATCHTQLVGKLLRGQTPTTHFGDAAHWPAYRSKDELQSLHVRFTECNRNAGVQPLKVGSDEYTDLEVFLSALSNGYPVVAPSLRD